MQIRIPTFQQQQPNFLQNILAANKAFQGIRNIPVEDKAALADLLVKQAHGKYAEKEILSKLAEQAASTGHLRAETGAIPQRLDIERGNLGLRGKEFDLNNAIKNLQYNPEKAAAEIARINSETEKNKATAEKNKVSQGIGIDQAGGPLSFYTPSNRTEAQKQFDTAQQLLTHINDLKKYGTEGTHAIGISGTPLYGWAHTNTGNKAKYGGTLAQSQDKFIALQKLRPTNYTLKTAEKALGRAPYEAPEDYTKRLDDFANSVQDRVGQLGQYLGKGGIPISPASSSAVPEFKSKEDFLSWKKTASPEQIAAAKAKHGV